MKTLILQRYKNCWSDRRFMVSAIVALVLLFAGIVANYYAGLYATRMASAGVTDLILDNIRVFDVLHLFFYGPIIFWVYAVGLCVLHPGRAPFVFKSVAVLIFVRSVFVSLTHLGLSPTHIPIETTSIMGDFIGKAGLFFSGHTAFPFLMALIYWKDAWHRWFFIAASLFFGVIVLLAHIHYSIDVVSAFFITYAVHDFSKFIFKKDRVHFE